MGGEVIEDVVVQEEAEVEEGAEGATETVVKCYGTTNFKHSHPTTKTLLRDSR